MEEYRSGHNGPHSKCGSPKGLVGSNPTSSANNGMWLSLVEHYVRDVGAAGSNPVIPTIAEQVINYIICFFFFFFEFVYVNYCFEFKTDN